MLSPASSLTGNIEATNGFPQIEDPADYTLTIADSPVEIALKKIISITTYNGKFPGPRSIMELIRY
jgi:hypothetical protein